MTKEVWTAYRKLMANLVPACLFVPVFAFGLVLFQRGYSKPALACFVASVIAGWFAVNFFGLFENAKMMRELRHLTEGRQGAPVFVGFAPPGNISLLDPHYDIGWFYIHPDAVEFIGEKSHYRLAKIEIIGVRFRSNVHSLIGLGRWLSIEGKRDGKTVRMLLEPRQRRTLLQNRTLGTAILHRLITWLKS